MNGKLIRRRNLRLSLIDVRGGCATRRFVGCEALAPRLIGPTADAEMNGRRADGNRRTPAAATAAPGGADDGQQSDTIGGRISGEKAVDGRRQRKRRGPMDPSAPPSADPGGRTDKAAPISDGDDGVKSPATGSGGVKSSPVAADRVHSVERLRLR
jgi:hypothetical protein